jgi:hypothetical protein
MADSTEYFGKPAPPSTKTCDWCGKPGLVAFEIYRPRKKVGTAQYLYPCKKHIQLAKEASRAPRRAA